MLKPGGDRQKGQLPGQRGFWGVLGRVWVLGPVRSGSTAQVDHGWRIELSAFLNVSDLPTSVGDGQILLPSHGCCRCEWTLVTSAWCFVVVSVYPPFWDQVSSL